MKEYFIFDKKSPAILYGAATIGCMLDDHLTSFGYQVEGFMDLRAHEMAPLHGKPVFSPDNENLSKDCIIILAVKNVFEHSRIAEDLVKRGFHRLIFRPYACLKGGGDEREKRLNAAYDSLTDFKGRKNPFEGRLPVTVRQTTVLQISGIVEEKDAMMTVRIPVTLLFSDKIPQVPEFSVLFMRPHLLFAKYVLGIAGGEVDSLIRYCREAASNIGGFETSVLWENNVVRNQAEVYAQMDHMYHLDKNFFIQQAPRVKWNEKKYFNLQSGKHRSTFLAAKGDNYITVKMSKDDFDKWVQASAVLKIQTELEKQYKQGLSIPIENPYFYEWSCMEEQFWYQLVRTLMDRISEIDYRNSKENTLLGQQFVVDVSDRGFLKRFLKRCGFEVIVWRETDELERKLDRLLGIEAECESDRIRDQKHVKYMIREEGTDNLVRACEVENLFLITDRKDDLGDKIMAGLCNGRQVSVYLKKNVIL